MTKDQRRKFYTRLRRAKDNFVWYFDSEMIRATAKIDKIYEACFCPITAISFCKTGKVHSVYRADEDLVDIGIPLERSDRMTLIDAADNDDSFSDQREVDVIRKTMLKIVGLQDT